MSGDKIPRWQYPHGFREFADKHDLPEWTIKRLLFAYDTIRGKRPDTLESWETFYNAVKPYLEKEAP